MSSGVVAVQVSHAGIVTIVLGEGDDRAEADLSVDQARAFAAGIVNASNAAERLAAQERS